MQDTISYPLRTSQEQKRPTVSREVKFTVQYIRTYYLTYQLQKDDSFEERIVLMKDIFNSEGISGHVSYDDKNLYINYTIFDVDGHSFFIKKIKPIYGDRCVFHDEIHDVVRDNH